MKNTKGIGYNFWFGIRIGISFMWAAPWMILAFIFGASIIGIPIAIALVGIASAPFHHIMKRHLENSYAYNNRDHPLEVEGGVPWEV
jgi:hypothetical protein